MAWECGCEPEWATHDEGYMPPPFVEFQMKGSLDAGDERFSVRYFPRSLHHDWDVVEFPEEEGGYTLWPVMVGRWVTDPAHGVSLPCEWVVYDADDEVLAEGRVS